MLNRLALVFVFVCCVLAGSNLVGSIPAAAQAGPSELLLRIERMENQLRQLTGQIEQMQYRNQQLEAALKRMQEDYDYRFQELGTRGGSRAPARPTVAQPAPPAAPLPSGRRSDAFDPAENPNAPGAPRTLGTMAPSPAYPSAAYPTPAYPTPAYPTPAYPTPAYPPRNDGGTPTIMSEEPPRAVGAPLDLNTLAGAEPPPGRTMAPAAGALPPPRSPGSTGPYAVATAPPTSSRETFDLGTGYLQRKDYALAEDTFREFLRKYPSDRLAAEAQYGLGESLFQRQSYQEAANAFVVLSKKYETSAKAPDALLRLGQSLAAINEKELACVAFGDLGRKYPRASQSVKQAVDREQKRVRC